MKGLPREARGIWAELLEAPVAEVATLRDEVMGYRKKIEAEAVTRDLFDHELGLRLADSCGELLKRWDAGSVPPEQRNVVQAAVRYFLRQRDGEDDFESVTGFDDDAAVINAVVAHLGFDDLSLD